MGAFRFDWKNREKDIARVLEILPVLKNRQKQKAGMLSTGEQQLLAFGRALMQKPKLLLADEPSLGLSPAYIDTIYEKLEEINKQGTSILLVEQNAEAALEIADRAYVFKIGSVFAEGTGKEIKENGVLKSALTG